MPNEDLIREVAMHPDIWIIDPELKAGKVETFKQGKLGFERPRRWGGQFAVVHKFKLQGKHYAYRFFTKDDFGDDVQVRNAAIDDNLKKHQDKFIQAGLSRAPWVEFKFYPKGYQTSDSKGRPHPLVRLPWCGETTLIKFLIDIQTQSRRQAASRLEAIIQEFVTILFVMHEIGMAHGDLSAGNIMVENDHLVLIDYDGMYFPDERLRRHPSTEKGNPKFQHPLTLSKRKYDERMDDFSGFLIALAMLSLHWELTEHPEKMPQDSLAHHLDNQDDGTILFRVDDLANPKKSEIFKKIRNIPNPTVKQICGVVERACYNPIDQVPRFYKHEALEKIIDPVAKLRELLSARSQDWKAIYQEAMRLRGENIALPAEPALKKAVDDVVARHTAYEELKEAVSRSPTSAKLIAKKATQARRDCAELGPEELNTVERAKQQVKKLTELESLEKNDPGYRQVLKLWESCKNLLAGCVEAEKWKTIASQWQPKIDACDTLLPLVRASTPWKSDIAIADAWDQLQAAEGHPDFDAVNSSMTTAIEACGKRRDCLVQVRKVLAGTATTELTVLDDGTFGKADHSDEETDGRLIHVWNEELLADCPDITFPEKSQLASAKKRIEIVNRLAQIVDQLDKQQIGTEQAVSEFAAELSEDYKHRWSDRVATSQRRIATQKELDNAIAEPISDARLSNAALAFFTAWESAIHQPVYDDAIDARIDRAHKRRDTLIKLYSLLDPSSDDSILTESEDRIIDAQWDNHLFREPPDSDLLCHDANSICSRVEHAKQRLNAVDTIRHAVTLVEQSRNGHSAPAWSENNIDVAGESVIVEAVAHSGLTEQYLKNLDQNTSARINHAQRRAVLSKQLLDLVATKPPCEKQIASTWEELQTAGGDPIARPHETRAKKACNLRDGLNTLESMFSKRKREDDEDQEILHIWGTFRLDESQDARTHRLRIKLAERRTEEWTRLKAAIERKDDFDITDCYDEQLLATYPPVQPYIEEIIKAKARSSAAKELLDAITNENPEQAAARFNRNFLDMYPSRFAEMIPTLLKWQNHIFARYQFQKMNGSDAKSLELSGARLKVTWNWRGEDRNPEHVFCEAIVGVGRQPLGNPDAAHVRENVTEEKYLDRNSSVCLDVSNDWDVVHVSIWPVIEFTCGAKHRLIGPPLQLTIRRDHETISRDNGSATDTQKPGLIEKLLKYSEE